MKIFNLDSLEDKLLISPTNRYDNNNLDYQSVIYICIQTDKNYIGFYINKPLGNIDINNRYNYHKLKVNFGGVINPNSYFILHSTKYNSYQSIKINENISLTKEVDVIGDFANNLVDDFIILNGYSAWNKDEINNKIKNENWICIESNSNLIFDEDDSIKWQNAISLSSELQPEAMYKQMITF